MRPSLRVVPLVVLLLGPLVAAQKPSLVGPESWDFGRVDQDVRRDHEIVLRNPSRRPINIRGLRATCGCIEASLDVMALPPGGEARLTLRLIAARGEGEIKKFVIIDSDDPARPQLRIAITGHIEPIWWVDVEGYTIDFGKVRNGDSVTRTIRLRVKPGHELKKVEALVHPTGSLQVSRKECEDEAGRPFWEFELRLGGRLENGSFEGMVRFGTDFAPLPYRGFRVVAEIVSSVVCRPERLDLEGLALGKTWTGRIEFEKTLGGGLTVGSFYCADPRVSLKLVTLDEGRRYALAVEIRPREGDQALAGAIEIRLDEPGQRVLKVPFEGSVAP
ncbi:MAG: DUF1573 domain-containing protein [Planctomycetes bacterium]|nr:DUF1573 domain-containing protein [Planctomycetota bacterium]